MKLIMSVLVLVRTDIKSAVNTNGLKLILGHNSLSNSMLQFRDYFLWCSVPSCSLSPSNCILNRLFFSSNTLRAHTASCQAVFMQMKAAQMHKLRSFPIHRRSRDTHVVIAIRWSLRDLRFGFNIRRGFRRIRV